MGYGFFYQIIIAIIEQAAIKNIKKIFVDTYAFQAVDFYIKQGFSIIGRLDKYLLGHDRIYLRKDLDL
ncbi:GNAT family N-acetyltransferase [Legionella fallonii]|uniref:Acetyltransferase n=1 Tax=Legionella fallonii LLAP-10 TaxID=1212491 RepID=A0A098G1S8_9GAMM